MSSVKVLKAGILSLLQDKGRIGLAHKGVSSSGYLDEYSALWANKLLDNALDAPLLEILFGDVEFQTLESTNISITGADCELFINGVKKPIWKSHFLNKNDTIKLSKVKKGNRIYLAIKGGFVEDKELESVSTSIKEGFGKKKIKTNDLLKFTPSQKQTPKKLKDEFLPKFEEPLILHVVLAYQHKSFPQKQIDKFFNTDFEITPDFNRMACKLKGENIESKLDGIISEGISFGAIQIPKDGQPIILLKERQTIGGYPKIGSVLPIDCFKLAQAKIGSKVKFEPICIDEAQTKLKKFYSSFRD